MSKRPLRRRGPRAEVDHAHLSGKFNRSPGSLRAQVLEAAEWASIITLTEVDYAARGEVLADMPGWTLVRGKDGAEGESAILVKDTVWRIRESDVVELTDDVPAARSRIVVPIALLEHVSTGATLLLSAGHLPSGVESSFRARLGRVPAYLAAVRRWRRIVRQWIRKHRPDAVLVVADWNLNLLRSWVRNWVRDAWGRLRPPTTANAGRKGDHGARLISWAIGRHLRHLQLRVLGPDPASDHRGIALSYVIRHRLTKEHR